MTAPLNGFRRYDGREEATVLARQLQEGGFHPSLRNSGQVFDATFSAGTEQHWHVLLPDDEFTAAEAWLEAQEAQAEPMPPDHYLATFSTEELIAVLRNADEWAPHDRAWARQLLAAQGKAPSVEEEAAMRAERLEELRRPEKADRSMLAAGVLTLFFGGFVAIVIGWSLRYGTKTLPDGSKVYRYTTADRNTGTGLMVSGTVILLFALRWLVRL